ncbi:Uncharacterised protein [Serratia quinivorans]|uniref:Uncharacterized protein n=1 Tax=Serratia quinivorans TaxID=137545 RepID=A0A380AS77_9GAMM|nr:Uncharacterised protein [Serratia quinivorans]
MEMEYMEFRKLAEDIAKLKTTVPRLELFNSICADHKLNERDRFRLAFLAGEIAEAYAE